ncbi:hypothetical protein OU798_02175 [Prolixibacteraceae bacterium Z1-6]|uniref:Uncharacterized protein n=1 Tax=Draconibacterium aestuarii TaxID=2998507 RepID=A0A9X3J569_9BACT|nr:hypothetical protein [Prolixibacteraceae bacterium Z1-6]
MKKLIVLTLIFLPLICISQIEIFLKEGKSTLSTNYESAENKELIKLYFNGDKLDSINSVVFSVKEGVIADYKDLSKESQNSYNIKYSIGSLGKSINFYKKNPDQGNRMYYVCDDEFSNSECANLSSPDPTQLLIPIFKRYKNEDIISKRNKRDRILIVDANSNFKEKMNNNIYKIRNDSLRTMHGLIVGSSLSVYITNYNFNSLKNISVSIEGEDYTYSKDISDILQMLGSMDSSQTDTVDQVSSGESKTDQSTRNKDYLETVLNTFSNYKYLNINDYMALSVFKDSLQLLFSKVKMKDNERILLSNVVNWIPQYISLTPIALTVPDKDEISIKMEIEHKNGQEYKSLTRDLGPYKTKGGHATHLSSAFVVTGLVNNKVYTDSSEVQISDTISINELHAFIKDDKVSIGVGVNLETSFRTGRYFRPTVNVGVFVPFEQDITPFLSLGGGGALVLKDVKFSLSGGLAGGFVNRINKKYVDRDLSNITNYAEDLSEKVPKISWQISFGVSWKIN